SAGGLTALGVAARHSALVAAVVAAYPVGDITELDDVTHRFEAHYNRTLMGDVDETRRKSLERSPLQRAGELAATPMLLMHGDVDPVVPVQQSRRLAEAVRAAGGEVELKVYEGEGHGFRDPVNKRDEYLRTEAFLVRHLSRRGIASLT
ncbi:MAG: alpha/beta hydrolase family protein, partial [Ilumatobacteraceae bacterium]